MPPTSPSPFRRHELVKCGSCGRASLVQPTRVACSRCGASDLKRISRAAKTDDDAAKAS